MTLLRRMIVAAPLLLLACGPFPPVETASLPRDSVEGAGDPTRAAIITASTAFQAGGAPAARPAVMARTLANLEFLAVNTVNNPLLDSAPATLQSQLLIARREWRAALDIPATVPAQQVVNRLYALSRTLDGAPGSSDPSMAARLQALPALPQTAAAAASAAEALRSRNTQGRPIR